MVTKSRQDDELMLDSNRQQELRWVRVILRRQIDREHRFAAVRRTGDCNRTQFSAARRESAQRYEHSYSDEVEKRPHDVCTLAGSNGYRLRERIAAAEQRERFTASSARRSLLRASSAAPDGVASRSARSWRGPWRRH